MSSGTVLITGAAGRIGSFLTRWLAPRHSLALTDVRAPEDAQGLSFTQSDIADLDAMRAMCRGVDTVVHLAADPYTTAPWESLLPSNIVGVYNVLQAAHEAGCRRLIFASTVNVVAGYPPEQQVRTDMPVRPANLYGASKAWGEAVARFYADQKNLSCLCLRFGWVCTPEDALNPQYQRFLDIGLTYADLSRLVEAAINAPEILRFGIYHGVSNNRFKRLDISTAREQLGYEPQDDCFAIAGAV